MSEIFLILYIFVIIYALDQIFCGSDMFLPQPVVIHRIVFRKHAVVDNSCHLLLNLLL